MLTFSKMLEITQLNKSEVARVLGVVPSSITSRINGTNDLKISELEKIEEYVGHKIYRVGEPLKEYDQVSIPYLEGYNVKLKHPKIKERLQFDKELTEDIWFKKAIDLRIMTMQGNNMNCGEYAIKNNDVLIIDTSIKKCSKPGIYAYTTNKTDGISIVGLQQKADGSLLMINYNKDYQDDEYTLEQLKDMEFKVIGRMIKNMSLTK